jgi:hypothetical protein
MTHKAVTEPKFFRPRVAFCDLSRREPLISGLIPEPLTVCHPGTVTS